MLNSDCATDQDIKVLDYTSPLLEKAMGSGLVNTTDEVIIQNIKSSIRRGHPQIRPFPPQMDRVCLVGSGPSLQSTLPELKELYFAGAKIVTVNGAYHWCIEHNLRPSTQIILDARPGNKRFLEPAIPQCRYVLASQCAPECWDIVEGRLEVWIFHASSGVDGPIREILDDYYRGQWFGVGGGVTVATRAISLLRSVGYLRFDLFGIDSCWMGETHHAFPQVENEGDLRFDLTLSLPEDETKCRRFTVSPWHLKQFEDFLQVLRINGDQFLLNVHGDGLLAHAMRLLGAGDPSTWQFDLAEQR